MEKGRLEKKGLDLWSIKSVVKCSTPLFTKIGRGKCWLRGPRSWGLPSVPLSPRPRAACGNLKAIVLEQMMLVYAKAGNKVHDGFDKFIDQRPQGILRGVYILNLSRLIKSQDHDLTQTLSWVKFLSFEVL